uniref:Calmodulin-binding domain-containing protein n=2 Tax=Acrobeloides nanus TaxID=290746 RepID=A0A914C406_9BILA
MAAGARLGAFGFNDKPKYTLYSSSPLSSFRDKPETADENRQPSVRTGKGYGVALISNETACARFKLRKEMLRKRLLVCDWSVYIALMGLGLGVLDVELHLALDKSDDLEYFSIFIRMSIILLTLFLDLLVVAYHYTEIQIMSADTGHSAYQCGFTRFRRLQICIELFVCTICPLPGNTEIPWPLLETDLIPHKPSKMPLYVLLTVPMFFRLYLLGRYVVLHSYMIRDPATRAIASFNRISVDFSFVLKTLIYDMPMTVVVVTALTFWLAMSWMMTQCERYATGNVFSNPHYFLDYAWFEAVTFFAIGYGDITVETYCGRGLALLTGLVGAVISSIITVLMGRKLLLSLSERRVNQVIAESQLSSLHKHAAARVLQCTWRTCLWQKRYESSGRQGRKINSFHLRNAQRNLLQSIFDFRKCKWRLRLRQEDEDDIITIRRV